MPSYRRQRRRAVGPDSMLEPDHEWSRRRLQVVLAGTAVVMILLLAGGAWMVLGLLHLAPSDHVSEGMSRSVPVESPDGHEPAPGERPEEGTGVLGSAQELQDRLAGEPLPTGSLEQALPGTLSTDTSGTLRLPSPTRIGDAGVATGFPRTPAGALAQLIAIDRAAITPGSIPSAQHVIALWAEPGGPTSRTWSVVEAVAVLLSAAGLPATGPADAGGATSVTGLELTAPMGFIKGTVGPDFVIPCVDLVIATTTPPARRQIRAASRQPTVSAWCGWGTGGSSVPDPSLLPLRRCGPAPKPRSRLATAGWRPLRDRGVARDHFRVATASMSGVVSAVTAGLNARQPASCDERGLRWCRWSI